MDAYIVLRYSYWKFEVHDYLVQGFLKICQLPSAYNYDNYWPVQKVKLYALAVPQQLFEAISYYTELLYFVPFQVPLYGTPHQVTYYAELSLYPLIVSVPVSSDLLLQ